MGKVGAARTEVSGPLVLPSPARGLKLSEGPSVSPGEAVSQFTYGPSKASSLLFTGGKSHLESALSVSCC